jgi:hypothetical protein
MLLAMALPPAALAQSAGDDQYQDPLGSGNGGSTQPSTPSRPAQSGGGSTQPAPPSPSASPKRTRSVPLARTGFDARIPATAGVVLLIGGGLLLIRPRRRRT